MASSGLLLSTATFIIAVSLTRGIARSKHRGVAVLHSFYSRESFYFRKSSPYLFKAAHSLLACLECSIGASVSISAFDSFLYKDLPPALSAHL